jgi:hypothetical protein
MTTLLERQRFIMPPAVSTGSTSYLDTLDIDADDAVEGTVLVAQQPSVLNRTTVRVTYRANRVAASVPSATGAISGTSFLEVAKLQRIVSPRPNAYDAPPTPALAFAALDLLRSDDELFKESVERLRSMDQVLQRDAICERLLRLLDLYQEDYEGHALSAESVKGLTTFLRDKPTARRPSIAATPTGNLYVSWKEATGQKLILHFLTGGRCRYSALVRNRTHVARLDEISGGTTADSIAEWIETIGIDSWIAE